MIYPFQASSGDVTEGLRIAFDGDAVLFSEDSEKIYKEKGLQAFLSHEQANANKPLPDGPFAKLFRKLAALQRRGDKEEQALIRTALVTARNSPADERVIETLRQCEFVDKKREYPLSCHIVRAAASPGFDKP